MSSPAILANRFDVIDTMGQGGMGVVLRGIDRETDRAVAIRAGRRCRRASADRIRAFQCEAGMLRQLDDPNIIKPLHAAQEDGTTDIVMEDAEGGSLAAAPGNGVPCP